MSILSSASTAASGSTKQRIAQMSGEAENSILFATGDLQLVAYSAMAFAMGMPMKDEGDPEPIVAAAHRILSVTGIEGDND